ncbi:MAG: SDR family oxidoreductase [Propionibacteriaceae bacterium]|jgi:acetoacetyl-CoA reductase/3-oxoacyl-[acyl-carrier protein] reductase|nr:SDR family oxidoreductase [Propionibacteriaceae bacterium]
MDQRTVLITGSSRGLGAHAALRFAEEGYNVVVNYARSEAEAAAWAARIRAAVPGADPLVCQADVADRGQVQAMFDAVQRRFGGCDVLINMAGVNQDGPFLSMGDEDWRLVLDTILTGAFLCSQEFARRYQGDCGQIVNIGAPTAFQGRDNGVNYCTARAGIMTFTRCLALELAPRIQVNTVTPGFIGTDEVMERYALRDQANYDKVVSTIPDGRLGTPEDIFRALRFLVGDASYVTGQNITVDGGLLRL